MKNTTPYSRVSRVCRFCLAYASGGKTLKQGERICTQMAAREAVKYPDSELGHLIYALCLDYYTSYGVNNQMLDRQILHIANYLTADLDQELH